MKKTLLLIAICLCSSGASGATYTWTGTASTSLNAAANWNPSSGTPGTSDSIVFSSTSAPMPTSGTASVLATTIYPGVTTAPGNAVFTSPTVTNSGTVTSGKWTSTNEFTTYGTSGGSVQVTSRFGLQPGGSITGGTWTITSNDINVAGGTISGGLFNPAGKNVVLGYDMTISGGTWNVNIFVQSGAITYGAPGGVFYGSVSTSGDGDIINAGTFYNLALNPNDTLNACLIPPTGIFTPAGGTINGGTCQGIVSVSETVGAMQFSGSCVSSDNVLLGDFNPGGPAVTIGGLAYSGSSLSLAGSSSMVVSGSGTLASGSALTWTGSNITIGSGTGFIGNRTLVPSASGASSYTFGPVQYPSGTGLAGVAVTLYTTAAMTTQVPGSNTGYTDASGNVVFLNLTPGTYYAKALKTGYVFSNPITTVVP